MIDSLSLRKRSLNSLFSLKKSLPTTENMKRVKLSILIKRIRINIFQGSFFL